MTDRFARPTRTLLSRFHRQRPLRAGSLIITILGDAIAPRGGVITLASLIRLAETLGLSERLVRTSVGRLANAGWLLCRRVGRLSEYELTAQGRSRFAEATRRIYGAAPQEWPGTWTLVLLPASAPRESERVRDELRWLGFGQLKPGLFAHPARTVEDARALLMERRIAAGAVVMQAGSTGAESDAQLVRAGWDLGELARRYKRFTDQFADLARLIGDGAAPSPETAFVVRTLLIHEYRKVHLRDPLLPRSLLPADWIGHAAYEACRSLYRQLFPLAEEFIAATAATLDGPLAAPDAQTYARFGGLPGPTRRRMANSRGRSASQ